MKNIKTISLLTILLFAMVYWTSCTKDWLEVDPIGKTVAENYFLNEEEIGMGLIAVYDFLHTDHLNDWSSPFIIKLLPSDDSNCGGGNAGDQLPYQQIDKFDWTPLNPRIETLYQICYLGIHRANKVINHNAEEETDLIKRYIAEAKLLRAYYYLDLVISFGGVPISPEESQSTDSPLPRESKETIFQMIASDLQDAAAGLPNKSEYSSADRFRASKQTALGLLVKAHVFNQNWGAAVSAFEELVAYEGAEVDLDPDFGQMFRIEGEFGIESLLEASFKSTQRAWDGWGQGWSRDGFDNDNRHIQLMNPRGDQGFEPGTSGMREGWGFIPPTDKIEQAFETGDGRKFHTVLSFDEFREYFSYVDEEGDSVFAGIANPGHDVENSIRMKYAAWASETIDPGEGAAETEFSTNWRLLRYADVLLLAAEAYARNGNDGAAITQLNKVRNRAGLPDFDGSDVIEGIKHERFVELAFEGQRYWDLVRWGDAANEIGSFVTNKHELFPIPQVAINNNPGLTQADQNPGY